MVEVKKVFERKFRVKAFMDDLDENSEILELICDTIPSEYDDDVYQFDIEIKNIKDLTDEIGVDNRGCRAYSGVEIEEIKSSEKTIEIPLEHAKNIYKVLENAVSMGFGMVSLDATKDLTEDQRKKFQDIFYKYHNANCGPFNRALKRLIDEAEEEN